MPEHRGREHHRERMRDALRDEIGALLEGELADPRIGLATVTEVNLAQDGKSAHVFVNASGDEREQQQTMKVLEKAKNYIRHEIVVRLGVRHCPELVFHLDKSEQLGTRIDELLHRTRKKEKKAKR
jgi:ribosome-binding factor A